MTSFLNRLRKGWIDGAAVRGKSEGSQKEVRRKSEGKSQPACEAAIRFFFVFRALTPLADLHGEEGPPLRVHELENGRDGEHLSHGKVHGRKVVMEERPSAHEGLRHGAVSDSKGCPRRAHPDRGFGDG